MVSNVRRRGMQWVDSFSSESNTLSVATLQTNLLLFNDTTFGGRHVKGATATRLLVDITLKADSVAQYVTMIWGITMVNADARAAGHFPDPNDIADRAAWMVRTRMMTIQASLSDSSQWERLRLDLRAQRVFRSEEDELHLIINNAGSFTLDWSAHVRTLIKDPP